MTSSGFDGRPQFDHLVLAVPHVEPVRTALAQDWGLHVHHDVYAFANGLANLVVPLEPPEYLELLFIADADAYARQPDDEAKRRLVAGGGLLGWGLRTRNINAVAHELGLQLERGMVLADGSRAPWRSLEKPGSPLGFPFYIEYDASPEDRIKRWTRRLQEVRHRTPPGRIQWVEASGDPFELDAWLRPARHLDIRVVTGHAALRAAVQVGDRLLTMSSDIPGGIAANV